ncbi:Plug domain-containing protein [Parabacteroides pacaensis]|uniref:Plug domain-containing protein n=1 Tax=Parabacteroides pacaensis TaxID=2086575 RepID=UPI000D109AAF|nr:Plug domain-containing protein [Parabacteroides pacaensis]
MKRNLFILYNLLWICHTLTADSSTRDSILLLFDKQLKSYPQEKLYVRTDKPYYIGGEDIWFRAYLTDYTSHIPDTTSRYIYTELINPLDSVISRIKTIPRKGAYYGYIHLDESLPEGNYQLRSYTKYMEGLGDSCLYRKSIYIGDPLSAIYRTDAEFDFEPKENKVRIRLRFIDIKSNQLIFPKEVRYTNKKEVVQTLRINEDSITRLTCNPEKDLMNRTLYIQYDYKGRLHQQFIPIPYHQENFEIDFLPEGGNFPANTNVRIAFKALRSDGLGEVVEGTVMDSLGKEKAKFHSNSFGMGSFYLTAKAGESLYAICKNKNGYEKRIKLPQAQLNTLSLQAQWSKDILNLFIANADDLPLSQDYYLVIHSRGAILYCEPWNNNQKYIQFRSKDLPSGVLQALLIDKDLNPLSERLIFNINQLDLPQITIQTNCSSYHSRDHILSQIQVRDWQQLPIEGDLSISVTDDQSIFPDSSNTILTTLLLTSELKGYIENPGWYFSESNSTGLTELDQLMLTQGWCRYNIRNILKDSIEHPATPLEIGPEISGSVGGGFMYSRKKAGYQVAITSFIPPFYETTETDKYGRFYFTHTEMPDSTRFLIQALSLKGKKNVEVLIDPVSYPSVQYRTPIPSLKKGASIEAYIKRANHQYENEHGMRMIYLDEVVVSARKRGVSPLSVSDSRIIPLKEIEQKSVGSLYILLKSIGGLHVTEDYIAWAVGNTRPAIIIDEIPWDPTFTDMDFIINMAKDLIEEVEVIRPGSFGANELSSKLGKDFSQWGALLITTKARDGGFPQRKDFNKKSIIPLGYQKLKEFYSPKYETQVERDKIPSDLRTTLYWNPSIQTINGNAQFDFYAADPSTTYTITLEGISPKGILIRQTQKIQIE